MAKEETTNEEDKDYEDWKSWKNGWNDKDWRKKYWMKRHMRHQRSNAGGGAIYFFGLVGALVYYWQHATTFWTVVTGFLQAIIWPAMLVWHLFSFLKL